MVIALDSGSSGPGSSPGQGHCVVFLGRHLTLTVTFYAGVNSGCGGNKTGLERAAEIEPNPGVVAILLVAS